MSEQNAPGGGRMMLADSILKGFAKRKERMSGGRLRAGDPAFFLNMLDRTQHVFARRRIWPTADFTGQQTVRLSKLRSVQGPKPERLRVVCVSSELAIWGDKAVMSMEPMRDGSNLLRPLKTYNYDAWMKARLAELKAAIALEPHAIIFPEFAYPPGPDPKAGGWSLDEIGDTVGRRVEFEQAALKLLGEKQIFLILGSFHCLMTLYNVAVIYPWGRHRPGATEMWIEGRETTDDGIIFPVSKKVPGFVKAPVMYRKRFPARKVGEQARVPAGQGINVFECAFGKVMVLICSDVLDLNQFMTIVRENLLARDLDFIIIPAYNPADSFGDICRDLSALSGATVIVANATDEGIGLTESEVYICGETIDEVIAADREDQKNLCAVETHTLDRSSLKLFELELKRLNDVRENQYKRLGIDDEPPEELPK